MYTIAGAATIPNSTISPTKSSIEVATIFARLLASVSDSFTNFCLKTGTKAEDKAPSANISLRRLGILKATTKASVAIPAPK